MEKSNFSSDQPLQLTIARELARDVIGNSCSLQSTWIPGPTNDVADSLSRDFHLSDVELTNLLSSSIPLQLPEDFHISPLPQEITSKLISWIQSLPSPKELFHRPTRSKLATGNIGLSSLGQLTAPMTLSCSASQLGSSKSYVEPSLQHTEVETSVEIKYSQAQSERPLVQWRRNLGITATLAQSTQGIRQETSLFHPSNASSKDTKTWTQVHCAKKLSQSVYTAK